MFRIEVLSEMSNWVPAHWIHKDELDLFTDITDARKGLRNFPSMARIVNVSTGEDVTGD